MTYKKKAAILSSLLAVLIIVYILTFVLSPENRRDKAFAWLASEHLFMADKVEISGAGGRAVLSRINNVWFFTDQIGDLPVKQERVGDLFALLSKKDIYPLRASSSEAIERLGVSEGSASRITIRGGAGLPLLDLLLGSPDALGEVYLRRAGWNQIYSSENNYSEFTEAKPHSWYDLRLFPSAPAEMTTDKIQQAEIAVPGKEPFIIRRSGSGWILPGNESASLENILVEAWLRSCLEAAADDFSRQPPEAAGEGKLSFWFGDGTSRTLEAGRADEKNMRNARVSGSSYNYLIGGRTYNMLFRDMTYFLKSESKELNRHL